MANPYPPHMPPMMQQPGQAPYGQPGQPPMPQMQQPPPGMPPRAAVVRRGTPRAVPVVVSAGLAIGVFCGLLFGLGTGDDVIAAPSTGNNVKPADPNEPKIPIPNTVGSSTTVKAPAATTPTVAATTPATGSAAGSAAGATAGSGSAAPAAGTAGAGSAAATPAPAGAGSGSAAAPAAPKIFKVKFKLIPDTLASAATITVDGKKVEGTELDVDVGTADKKSIKVVVKAPGYRSYEKTLSVDGDTDMQVEMTKRPVSRPRPSGGGRNGGNSGGGGGGLIDI